ncbi:GNAT family N-acetyltransferase [Sphingomonas psychrotolerans]|uniref:GNAT family N-acetyltransferase n=1 Tax=Sphingomonas psychrotolerans TaxID=1327635 RepID=A0ABU3MZN9_9SPHN|nr:GNAT family N-acetyltransferase [Sphingomonas psychrotolerans]MDT8757769.1 GNAT family N-acetyltransferase [Sphingomonas psychrotolerans]
MPIGYERWQGSVTDAAEPLLALCRSVFPDFAEAYLLDRLPRLADPMLWLAVEGGAWKGFKLAYRRGDALLYSWLGGVAPELRGKGVASELMRLQHEAAAALGYRCVETRTRAANNPMILLNLRHGFHIAGFETDARGIPVVIQRKVIAGPDASA